MSNLTTMEEYLAFFEEALKGKAFSPAFPERLMVLRRALSEDDTVVLRTVAAPIPTTDLGIRLFPDYKLFYRTHTEIAHVEVISNEILYKYLLDTDIKNFGKAADAIVLFFGEYEIVAKIAMDRSTDLLALGSYVTLIQVGVVLGAVGNPMSLTFFKRAEEVAESPEKAYAAVHRLAATYIKRLTAPKEGIIALRSGYEKYLKPDQDKHFAEIAVYYNLLALAHLSSKDDLFVEQAMDKAEKFIDEAISSYEVDTERYSQASRYKSQIAINRAQIAVKNGQYIQACGIMQDDVDFCGRNASEYLAEAEGVLALCEYRAKNFNLALQCASVALEGFKYIGDISAVHEVRKIALASLAKKGCRGAAEKMVQECKHDPLGIRQTIFSEI